MHNVNAHAQRRRDVLSGLWPSHMVIVGRRDGEETKFWHCFVLSGAFMAKGAVHGFIRVPHTTMILCCFIYHCLVFRRAIRNNYPVLFRIVRYFAELSRTICHDYPNMNRVDGSLASPHPECTFPECQKMMCGKNNFHENPPAF